jgi:hypothetical protein
MPLYDEYFFLTPENAGDATYPAGGPRALFDAGNSETKLQELEPTM